MADSDIDGLPDGGTAQAGDAVYAVRAGADTRIFLSRVAGTGSFDDLEDKPELGSAAFRDATEFLSPDGDSSDLSQFGASGPNHAPGIVPDPGSTAGTERILYENRTWALPKAVQPGNLAATIGDSLNANATISGQMINCGAMTNARILTGQRIQYAPQYNLAVGGTNLGQILTQVDGALALNPAIIHSTGITNDLAQGLALEDSWSNFCLIAQKILARGIIWFVSPFTPRKLNFSTTLAAKGEEFNRRLMELGAGNPDYVAAAGVPANRLPIILDRRASFDYSATDGSAPPGLIGNDNLHWAWGQGLIDGAQIADHLCKILPPRPTVCNSPYDIYDATNHRTGNLMVVGGVNAGMLGGSTSSTNNLFTQNGLTPTGVISPYLQVLRQSGTSTAELIASKVARPEGVGGEGVRLRMSSQGNGNSRETYGAKYFNGIVGVNSGFQAGDTVVFECSYRLNGAVNLLGVSAMLQEYGPASPQTCADGVASSNATIGLSSSDYPALLLPGVLRTPPMQLQSGVTNLFPSLQITTWGNAGPNSFDIELYDWSVRHA